MNRSKKTKLLLGPLFHFFPNLPLLNSYVVDLSSLGVALRSRCFFLVRVLVVVVVVDNEDPSETAGQEHKDERVHDRRTITMNAIGNVNAAAPRLA
jgi:hypothetical protein